MVYFSLFLVCATISASRGRGYCNRKHTVAQATGEPSSFSVAPVSVAMDTVSRWHLLT